MWTPFAFWLSLITTLITGTLIALVIRAGVKRPGNLAAFIMFLGMLIWNLGELIERLAGPPPNDEMLAYLGGYILCIGFFLTPAGVIHFTIDYPYRLKMSSKVRLGILSLVYAISIIGILIIPFNTALGNIVLTMNPYPVFGIKLWGIEPPGPVHKLFSVWTLVAALIFMVVMLLKLRGVKLSIIKQQIFITLIGFFIMFVLIVVTTFIPMVVTHFNMYPLTTLAFSLFGITVIYTIVRYRMFLVSPSVEEKEEDIEEELPESEIYEMKWDEAYNKFVRLAKSGNMCIGFITDDPEKFREKSGLKQTPLFQITKTPGKDRLNPNIEEHREMISFIISSFLEQVYKPVILLDLRADWISDDSKKKLLESIRAIQKEIGGIYLVVK